MKTIYNLVKKDYILIKKSLLIMLLFVTFAPIFISMRAPEFQNNGTLLYGMLALMITFMTYHMISMEEMKQKGFVYLQITPMSNKKIAISKYIVVTLAYLATTIIYCILALLPFTKVGGVGIKGIMLSFAIIELFFGIYIPLTFKLGYVKLQMVSSGIIFLSPFIISLISKYFASVINITSSIQSLSDLTIIVGIVVLTMIVISIGSKASSNILKKQEY
ncbi:MAG: ABC-2 transporter permease [Clostridiaceae bacterium]|nr:ABC-2 transporter permease [Clostridiaceae bacterium]MBW4859494.1 ABC-2 transporter permease [Clostridiaceae bacterium]MBW4867339.1 ABC-2 transporter permease [Clostridiaceae bacterium]